MVAFEEHGQRIQTSYDVSGFYFIIADSVYVIGWELSGILSSMFDYSVRVVLCVPQPQFIMLESMEVWNVWKL